MVSPALTVPWSATLAIVTTAQLPTLCIVPSLRLPALLVVTDAELLTVPQVADVGGGVIWTVQYGVGARSPGPKSRTFFFNDTATTEIYALSLHDALPIFGTVSETVTLRAMPAPVLVTVTT